MKTYLICVVLCCMTLMGFSQKLELEKASPFTAVKWEQEQPIVQFNNDWYHFEKLDHFSKKELLEYCKTEFGDKWQRRFSEDLVEVLKGMDYQPNISVTLMLSKEGVSKNYTGKFTYENRQSSLQYNREHAESKSSNIVPQKITKAQAIADLKQFEDILNTRSSYTQLSTFDYTAAINKEVTAIENQNTDVDVNVLTNNMSKIMSEIGDRHASVRNEAFNKNTQPTYDLRLPFGIATVNGQVVALKQNANDDNYTYYDSSHPQVISINGIAVEILIDSFNHREKKAPTASKISRGTYDIQKFGELLFKNNIACPDSITVVFSDGTTEKTETLQLTTDKKGYISKLLVENYKNCSDIENGNFEGLSSFLEYNIGYINIPMMSSYDDVEELEGYLENTLQSFSKTKAVIIDLRYNPGGSREILQTCASYIVQPEQSPWVANVAYLRTDDGLNTDEESMSSRYLYNYNSGKLTNEDRQAIDQFNTNFKLQHTFDPTKFSTPFYMVLHNGKEPFTQPVYILVNEESFSASTVFTSAFKGLPNVKIVGVTTDGSSGNSRVLHLKHSNIRVKVSTMLSFQRNGKTLDGNGTVPDIIITTEETQVLNGVDMQLNELVELINTKR